MHGTPPNIVSALFILSSCRGALSLWKKTSFAGREQVFHVLLGTATRWTLSSAHLQMLSTVQRSGGSVFSRGAPHICCRFFESSCSYPPPRIHAGHQETSTASTREMATSEAISILAGGACPPLQSPNDRYLPPPAASAASPTSPSV